MSKMVAEMTCVQRSEGCDQKGPRTQMHQEMVDQTKSDYR